MSGALLTDLDKEILRACWVRGDVSRFDRAAMKALVDRCLLLWRGPAVGREACRGEAP